MKYTVTFIFCCILLNGISQNFLNSDLNGTVNFVSVPTNWTQVPFNDPSCQGNSIPEATVDVVDITGPSVTGGVFGNPFSGTTFCSGLHAFDGINLLWHEGIMQVVSGLTVGVDYTISLYQTVLKQTNCLDESGSWRVYVDNNLIATTIPSNSVLLANDPNILWENRLVAFTATSTSHTIKFMAWDDDANQSTSNSDLSGGLRMGIDLISFVQDAPQIDLGTDTLLCIGEQIILDATYTGSTYLWNDNSTNATLVVNQPGTYWVTTTNSFGSDTDTIIIEYTSITEVNLGPDILLCFEDSIVLSSNIVGTSYQWQDGSNLPSLSVYTPGQYSIIVTSYCGVSSGSINILYHDCTFHLEMPNVFTPNGDPSNNEYHPILVSGISEGNIEILNRWGLTVFRGDILTDKWDGTSKGKYCTEGVYFWKVNYTRTNNEKGSQDGYVYLLR